MKNRPIYILGTALSHDGSSCLMKDGRIIVAIQKERLTRIKHDGFNDNLTIDYCLSAAGIRPSDLTLIVEKNTFNLLKPEDRLRRAGRHLPDSVPRVNISHHLAHAYGAVGSSSFGEAAVVVMDGQGSSLDNAIDIPADSLPEEIRKIPGEERFFYWEKESCYEFVGGRMRPVFRDFSKFYRWDLERWPAAPNDMEHSIAEFYGGVARFVFGREWCEGRLMGLAPFGRPDRIPFEAFEYDGPRVKMRTEWLNAVTADKASRFGSRPEDFQFHADLARWAQDQTEQAVRHLFRAYHEMAPHRCVAYSGGLALNAVINGCLAREGPYDEVFVQPAASDCGLAVGCAYYGWCEVLGRERVPHDRRSWFGRTYPRDEVLEALRAYEREVVYEECSDPAAAVADLLVDGLVVGWFQEGSEFGPRALGHRSMLADPRRAGIRDHINTFVKFREDFRPLAPIVPAEDAAIYFEIEGESPHMTQVVNTREPWRARIPAVVHVDGTARLQTVRKEDLPGLHAILRSFEERTGVAVLLNTSLNTRDEPIVETPMDALRCLARSGLDVLVMDNYLVRRREHA